MKRRDEAGRAESGPFCKGLAGQAATQAESQAQSSIYAQMPPPHPHPTPSCFTGYMSAQPDVLFWVKITYRGGGEGEILRPLPPTIMSLRHTAIAYLPYPLTSSASIQSRLIWDLKRCLMLKTLPRSVFVSLPHFSLLSLTLPLQDFTLHIPFAGCYLEQWFHLLPKTVSHLFRVGEGRGREEKKKLLLLSPYLPSAFFSFFSYY